MVGLVMVVAIVLTTLAAPLLSPHDPLEQNLDIFLKPPVWDAGGIPTYPLGTDHFGRDILSRILYGAQISLIISLAASLVSAVIGSVAGLLAGYYRGWLDVVIMRLVDTQLAFPMILLALALTAVVGPSLNNIILVLGVTSWMMYARVVRGVVLSVQEREFVHAAYSLGAQSPRIIFLHILPSVLTPIIVMFTQEVARMILMESGLSFLGLGVPPPTPTWGRMLSDARGYLTVAYWNMTFPGIAIMLSVLGITFLGDGLRDAIDPKLRT
jgi:peptide/nickel transport system permease protein